MILGVSCIVTIPHIRIFYLSFYNYGFFCSTPNEKLLGKLVKEKVRKWNDEYVIKLMFSK